MLVGVWMVISGLVHLTDFRGSGATPHFDKLKPEVPQPGEHTEEGGLVWQVTG